MHVSILFLALEKNCTSVFITLSIPCIRLVVAVSSELVFDDVDDDDDDGVVVKSGNESIQK
jgi:hypothetical protein